jgi:hypothetical protein
VPITGNGCQRQATGGISRRTTTSMQAKELNSRNTYMKRWFRNINMAAMMEKKNLKTIVESMHLLGCHFTCSVVFTPKLTNVSLLLHCSRRFESLYFQNYSLVQKNGGNVVRSSILTKLFTKDKSLNVICYNQFVICVS